MLRTHEFDQPHADGDRPRHWPALSRPPRCRPVSVAPPSLAALPATTPNPMQRPAYAYCRQKRATRQNSSDDRIRLAKRLRYRVAKSNFCHVCQQNELADLADMADSQKPALFDPRAFHHRQKTPQKPFSAMSPRPSRSGGPLPRGFPC